MKLNVMFIIAAIFLILVGLLGIIAPASLVGYDVSASFNSKLAGVGYLSLGLIAWLVRKAEPSKTRNSVVIGYIVLFILWTAVSIWGCFLVDMPTHTISWIPAVIQALLAIGFIVAEVRASKPST
jgi:hypothetical protein